MTPELLEAAREFAAARERCWAHEITDEQFALIKSVWACTALQACLLHSATFPDSAADIGAPQPSLVSAA